MKKALVVFSGGQDSTTCLCWALKHFDSVTAISFDYGQRHKVELECAKNIAKKLNIAHSILNLHLLQQLTKNALTHKEVVIEWNSSLPSTFVPARNLHFLSFAATQAYEMGINDIVAGVCQTDFSGYPDCRDEFVRSLEHTLYLALLKPIVIHTPLMFLTKKETVELMRDLEMLDLLSLSHTCYYGKRPACGLCPACKLRLKGFSDAKISDPLEYEIS